MTHNPPSPIAVEAFKGLLEAAPDAFVIVDADGIIVQVNSQTERLFGYDREEMVGQPIELLLPERLRHAHLNHRTNYISEPHTRPMGVGLDLVARRRDNSEFDTEISLSPFRFVDRLLITAVIRDVTERKRAADELERQVRDRTAHLNALLQFSGELLLARNLDTVLQRSLIHALALVPEAHHATVYLYDEDANQLSLRASVGLDLQPPERVATDTSLVGRAFTSCQRQHLHAADDWLRLFPAAETVPTGAIAQPLIVHATPVGVLVLIRNEGRGPFALEALPTLEGLANLMAAALLQDRSRTTAATLSSRVASLEDQQRHMAEKLTTAEAAMLQSARLAAMGQLAASIAHEINNPLYAVRNCLLLVEEDMPTEQRDSPYLVMAREQLERIAKIIERMRDFYRPARGDLAPIDLNRLLSETLALAELNVRSSQTLKTLFLPAESLPLVVANDDQLRQVFLNLVLNAIDAIDGSGTLTIKTSYERNSVVVAVSDTGGGISPSDQARIFEPFFTTKPQGTGLGLAISAHIIQQHNGRLDVESTLGQGSTFYVILPAASEQARA